MKKYISFSLTLLLCGIYAYPKKITFSNRAQRPVVLSLTPGRSSKISLGTKSFEVIIPAQDTKTVTVYSEKFGGKGDYIKNLEVAWADQDSKFERPLPDLVGLNTFIQSQASKNNSIVITDQGEEDINIQYPYIPHEPQRVEVVIPKQYYPKREDVYNQVRAFFGLPPKRSDLYTGPSAK